MKVEAIHHVGLVVKDLEASERFYVDVLGFERAPNRPWFRLNATSAIHLIPFGTGEPEPPHHRFRHVALRVADLRSAHKLLLGKGLRLFQAGFDGSEKVVESADDPLDFGTGSLFLHDPDGNLIEFLQLGHGIFAQADEPQGPGPGQRVGEPSRHRSATTPSDAYVTARSGHSSRPGIRFLGTMHDRPSADARSTVRFGWSGDSRMGRIWRPPGSSSWFA